ncbi:MAG: class II aldolase/adducin family protein, partial [Nostoc sp.]
MVQTSFVRPSNPFQPPTFVSIESERRHRQERLAAAFRVFARLGFAQGLAGHITARDP